MARKTSGQLHVFVGSFSSREEACQYTEPQWQPEPGDEASDEEYAAWEDRNPIWPLREELGVGLDSDFIETIDGHGRYEYLLCYLVNPSDLELVRKASQDANFLVLLFPDALHDRNAKLHSTSKLTYCGAFDFCWS